VAPVDPKDKKAAQPVAEEEEEAAVSIPYFS